MTRSSGQPREPLKVWTCELLRLTTFVSLEDVSQAAEWWRQVTGVEPETIIDKRKTGERIETGPPHPIEAVAVAVCRSGNGTHAGVVYRNEDGSPRFLHFAFHRCLLDDPFTQGRHSYVCVVPNLLRPDAVALAGYCRRIHRTLTDRGRRIPYNLVYEPDTGFDPETGDLILPEHATGMSCATFVVHVFRSSGNPIVNVTGWASNRPGDRERQEELVAMLTNHPAPTYQQHGERIRGQIRCPRVRPEDVVGGCLEDVLPARFNRCDVNGRALLHILEATHMISQPC